VHSKPALSSPTPAWREATCLWQYPPSALKLCRSLAPNVSSTRSPMTSAGCHDLFPEAKSHSFGYTLSHPGSLPILPSHAPQACPNWSQPCLTMPHEPPSSHPRLGPELLSACTPTAQGFGHCPRSHGHHMMIVKPHTVSTTLHPITRVPFQGITSDYVNHNQQRYPPV